MKFKINSTEPSGIHKLKESRSAASRSSQIVPSVKWSEQIQHRILTVRQRWSVAEGINRQNLATAHRRRLYRLAKSPAV